MKTLVGLAYSKHNEWIKVVKSFGCNPDYVEDIVQEMYIQLHLDTQKGIDFSYKDDINHYYIYKVLRGIYLNKSKIDKRKIKVYIDEEKLNYPEVFEVDEDKWQADRNSVDEALNDLYWYDKKVFEIIASGTSISELHRKTGISYDHLRNTYINAKNQIKNKLKL